MRQRIGLSALLAGALFSPSGALGQDTSGWSGHMVTEPPQEAIAQESKDICGWTLGQRMAAAKAVLDINKAVDDAISKVTGEESVQHVPLRIGSLLPGEYHIETYAGLDGRTFAFGQTNRTRSYETCDGGNQSVFALDAVAPGTPADSRSVSVWTRPQLDACASGVLADITSGPVASLSSFGLSCHVDRVTATVSSRGGVYSSSRSDLKLPSWLALTCSPTHAD